MRMRACTQELLHGRRLLDRSHQFAAASHFRGVYRQLPEEGTQLVVVVESTDDAVCRAALLRRIVVVLQAHRPTVFMAIEHFVCAGGRWACVIEHEERLYLLSVRDKEEWAAQDFDLAVRYYGGPFNYLNFKHAWGPLQAQPPALGGPPALAPAHALAPAAGVGSSGGPGVPVSRYAFGMGGGAGAAGSGNNAVGASQQQGGVSGAGGVGGNAGVTAAGNKAQNALGDAAGKVVGKEEEEGGAEGGQSIPQHMRPIIMQPPPDASTGVPHQNTGPAGHAVAAPATGAGAPNPTGALGPIVLGTSLGSSHHLGSSSSQAPLSLLLQHPGSLHSTPGGAITLVPYQPQGSNVPGNLGTWPGTPTTTPSNFITAMGGLTGPGATLNSPGGIAAASSLFSPEENLARLLMSPGGAAAAMQSSLTTSPGGEPFRSPGGEPFSSLGLALSTLEALGSGHTGSAGAGGTGVGVGAAVGPSAGTGNSTLQAATAGTQGHHQAAGTTIGVAAATATGAAAALTPLSPGSSSGGPRPQLRLIPHFYDHIAAREAAAAAAATATTAAGGTGGVAVAPGMSLPAESSAPPSTEVRQRDGQAGLTGAPAAAAAADAAAPAVAAVASGQPAAAGNPGGAPLPGTGEPHSADGPAAVTATADRMSDLAAAAAQGSHGVTGNEIQAPQAQVHPARGSSTAPGTAPPQQPVPVTGDATIQLEQAQ